jgi:CubicO group peptidase (beta-lactamase class C family)
MRAEAIDGILDRAVTGRAAPGIVAMVGDRDGVIYEGAAGLVNIDGTEPASLDTMFAIMSMTKAFTSVAALQLVERGELALEQPVAEVLPAFDALQVLDGFDGEEPRLRPPASRATIRHLLTHTSGAAYPFLNADLLRYHAVTGLPDVMSGSLEMLKAPLVCDPGTRWEYGTSTDWLGQVVEAVTGMDLGSCCRERIFAPLAMPDATFAPSEEQAARMMALHFRLPDGGLLQQELELPEPEFQSGGSGACATAPDYMRFIRALLRGGKLDGERILAPETVDLMFSEQLEGAVMPDGMTAAVPMLSNDVPSMPVPEGWGLGLRLALEGLPGMRAAGTGDWGGLLNCAYWIDRATGVAAVIMTQLLPFYDAAIVQTFAEFELGVYAEIRQPQPA